MSEPETPCRALRSDPPPPANAHPSLWDQWAGKKLRDLKGLTVSLTARRIMVRTQEQGRTERWTGSFLTGRKSAKTRRTSRTWTIRVDSKRDLSVLGGALGKTVTNHYLDRLGHRAVFSLMPPPKTPTTAVLRFSRLLSRLPSRARAVWRTATVRELDIGIEAGTRPAAAEWTLSKAAMEEAARIGARIRLTVYAAEQVSSAAEVKGTE